MTLPNSALLNRVFRAPRHYLYFSGLILLAGLALSLGDASRLSPWPRVIVGLAVFILPGGYLFALIPARDSWDLIDFVGYGFSFSIALITILGLITRTFALTIDVVELIWYLLAILGFAAVFFRWRQSPTVTLKLHFPVVALLLIIFIQVALFAHSSIIATPATDDQNRHHAAVNGFLHEEPLGWSEPYYETGNLIADRMYLTYWVLAQALVVEISGAPILLARYLINPFAMTMSVTAMYIFARNLGHSRKMSLVYTSLGLFALSLVAGFGPQAGSQFFARALLDKVLAAFALTPIAISSAFSFVNRGKRRALLSFALSYLATAFVHAILGGFAACIIGAYCLIAIVANHSGRKNAFKMLLLTILLLSPAIFIRLTTTDATIYYFEDMPDTAGNMRLYETVNPLDNGNSFYAIDSRVAGDLTYILIVLTILALIARRLDSRSRLMLAYALAIGFGLLPFTAWLYGRLVSFYHVVRILWLMPYGYMLGFTLETAAALARGQLPAARRLLGWFATDRALLPLMALAAILTAHFLQFNRKVDFSRDIATAMSGDSELLQIAEYIDAQHNERVWIAASPESRSRAITMNWKVIELSRFTAERMSYYSSLPREQMEKQLDDNLSLYAADVQVAEKLAIIDRYGIDYLLFPKGYAWMIDALYQTDKQRFELVYSGETLRLVRVH